MDKDTRYRKGTDIADWVCDLSDEDLFKVAIGRSILTEEPVKHDVRVVPKALATPEDMRRKLDIDPLVDYMVQERPELVGRVADGFRMAIQTEPELLARARNEVRRNFSMAPIVEVGYTTGPIIGKITAQNDSQSVITDLKGAKSYVVEHDDLELGTPPKKDALVKIERSKRFDGKFTAEPHVPTLKQGGGLTR